MTVVTVVAVVTVVSEMSEVKVVTEMKEVTKNCDESIYDLKKQQLHDDNYFVITKRV